MRIAEQVILALRKVHPDLRKEVRGALRLLDEKTKGDVKALQGELEGFYRLRAGRHRLIFHYTDSGEVLVEFFAPREVIYDIFVPPGKLLGG